MNVEEDEPPFAAARRSASAVLDASAVLALLSGEPGAELVADTIADGAVLSAVNYSEIAVVLERRGEDAHAILRRVREQVTIEPFTTEDAAATAALANRTRNAGLSLADRACLSLAQRLNVPAVTADRQWLKLDLGIEIHMLRSEH